MLHPGPRAADLTALRRAVAYSPITAERAGHALTGFGIDGTVTSVAKIGGQRRVADVGEHVPSSTTVESYALTLADGRVLVLMIEGVVYGGADAEVDVTVTLIGPDGVTLGSDTVGL